MGRPVPARSAAHRRRTHDPRHGPGIRAGEAAAARDRCLYERGDRSRDLPRDGHSRPDRRDASGRVRLRGRGIRVLRARCARNRAGRFRLSLDEQRSVVVGDVSHLRLRRRRAAQTLSAEARQRRVGRLLRSDGTGRRIGSRRDENAGREGRRRIPADRFEDVDLELADRRRLRRLGEVGRSRQPDPRLRPGEGDEGSFGAEDQGQALAARNRSPAKS